MLKTNFLNICIYILVRTIIFFFILMILNNDFTLLKVSNIKNGQGLFLYLWLILFFPMIEIILFSAFILYTFQIKRFIAFLGLIGVILLVEYFLYVYFTSQKSFDRDGIIKIIVSAVFMLIFFYKSIPRNYFEVKK